MNVANIVITDNIITVTDAQKLTSGSVGDTVSLTWEGEWGNLRKHIVFRASDAEADIILPPAILEIPAQLLGEGNRTLTIAAYGEDSNGAKVIVTEDTEIGYIFPGTDRSYRREPYPGWAAQIEEAVEEANDTANSVRNDANIGKFDGATYTPNSRPVNGGHELSWTNDKGKENPDPIIVKNGENGHDGSPGLPGVYEGETPPEDGSPVWLKPSGGLVIDTDARTCFATCAAEAAPSQTVPVTWYVPKTMPRPSGNPGMLIDVFWKNGRASGLGYDVSLVWGEEGGVDNEVIVSASSTTDSLTGEYSIPTEGTVRYQLEETNGRKHWRYVSGDIIGKQFSTSTAAEIADKVVPGMEISYLPGMEIYLQLDKGNTADLMNLVPADGQTLPVYGNGMGAKTGSFSAGAILHLKNAGDHWQILNTPEALSHGITGAKIGDLMQITAVDEKGVPTALKPISMEELEGKWELIESGTLTETSGIERKSEVDGTPYSFCALLLKLIIPVSTFTGGAFEFFDIEGQCATSWLMGRTLDDTGYIYAQVVNANGTWNYVQSSLGSQYSSYLEAVQSFNNVPRSRYGNIRRLSMSAQLPAGTQFEIWGVRA